MSTPERCGAFDTLTHEVCILANDHRGRHVMESDQILESRIRSALTDEVLVRIENDVDWVRSGGREDGYAVWREGIVAAIMKEGAG